MKEKLQRMSQLLLAVAVFMIVLGFNADTAKAASDISQSAQTEDSITINWANPVRSGYTLLGYSLGYGTDSKSAKAMADSNQVTLATDATSYTITGLTGGTSYTVYIKYDYQSSWGSKSNSYIYGYSLKTTPGTVTGLNQDRWYRFIEDLVITWNRQEAVDGYEYVFSKHNGQVVKSGETTGNSITFDVKNYIVYKAKIRAYTEINGTRYYGNWCGEGYFFTQPSKSGTDAVVGAKIAGSKLKVNWKKMDGVNGYNVYVSTNATNGYKKVKTVNANKKSVSVSKLGKKKFKKNKTYYVYVQAYKKVGGIKYTTGVNYITVLNKNRTSYTYADSNGTYE